MKDYQKTIPKTLWDDASLLIDYVTHKPFEPIACCPYCGGKKLKDITFTGDLHAQHQCLFCQQTFNNLTGTYFAKQNRAHLELWPEFVKLRLAGVSLKGIAIQINISRKAATNRDRILLTIMFDRYPKLYEWWHEHTTYQDKKPTEIVNNQARAFKGWLKNIINQQTAHCPSCGRLNKRRIYTVKKGKTTHRPSFKCMRCDKSYSVLRGTTLGPLQHIEKWLPFTQLLIEGKHNTQLSEKLKMPNKTTIARWRKAFLEQMKLLNYNELIFWIEWQLQCNKVTGVIKGKTKNNRKL